MKAFARIALILACASSLAFGVSCAAKQKKPQTTDDFFAMYDANGDSVVTEDEFVSKWKNKDKAHKNFNLLDLEGNGSMQRNATQDLGVNAPLWNQIDMDDDTAQEP